MNNSASSSGAGGDSSWKAQPATGQWNTAANWDTDSVPTDTANFGTSSQTEITFSPNSSATVNIIVFAVGAGSFTFRFSSPAPNTPPLTIAGKGVFNHSRSAQSFIVASIAASYKNPQLKFANFATAGEDDVHYYAGPETLQGGYGGGIIGFCDKSTAGSASFVVRTGAVPPPQDGSTVGGEVSFSDRSSAGTARFTIYGTLGTDGDTFGNTVFHDSATADHATFTNVGGTVSGGDGGNTQFYDTSTAAYGVFNNYGGTFSQANGGDVAFDGTANGGYGQFFNHAAKVAGAYGGVTSFNNNPPEVATQGASAGNGYYHNYGAHESGQGGGGHTEFSARHGSPTADNGTFNNYGSASEDSSSAGHTVFSISLPTNYYPTAGNGTFWNHPAVVKDGAAGFTEFSVYSSDDGAGTGASSGGGEVPTAGNGTFHNLGGKSSGAAGGFTVFKNTSSAGNAQLIAYGGSSDGEGGRIVFYDDSSGGSASVQLYGNGVLDIGYHNGGLTIGSLVSSGGVVNTQLGNDTTGLTLSGELTLNSAVVAFSFWKQDSFTPNTAYTILSAPNLSSFTPEQFTGNSLDGVQPTFTIVGNKLQVSFNQ